jgi:branched-chain amino acid transport system permease protein
MTLVLVLQFLLIGLTTGAIYVGISSGLMTIYRSSGIINFAQGAMGVWGAYVYAELRTSGKLVLPIGDIPIGSTSAPVSLWLAVILGVVCSAALGLLIQLIVFRPMRNAPALGQVVASIAVLIALEALTELRFGATQTTAPPILPTGSWTVGTLVIHQIDVWVSVIGIALMIALWAFFKFTTTGIVSRATAANPRAVSLMGYSPDRLNAIAWTIGTTLSGFLIMLAAPATGLIPSGYALYVVPAMAVLLLARLNSILVITIASFALGSFQSFVTLMTTQSWYPAWATNGIQDAVPFVVIIVILLVFGKRLPSRGSLGAASLPTVRMPRFDIRLITLGVVIGVVCLLATSGQYRFGVISSMAMALIALSYVIIAGFVGQISLAQISLAGVAAFAVSKVTGNWGFPFPVSMIFAALVATIVGMVVAIPAFRLRGAQLAVVTVAAGVALQDFVFGNPSFTPVSGLNVPAPKIGSFSLSVRHGSDVATLRFGFTVLVILVLISLLYVLFAGGETGRLFLAVRSNERAAASAGIAVSRVKLVAFALSGFVAGIGGCLIGYSRGQLSFSSFSVFAGMEILAVAYLGGITSLTGALIASALGPLGIVYVFINSEINFGKYYQLIAGIGLVLTAVLNPDGIAGQNRQLYERCRHKLRRRKASRSTPSGGAPVDASDDLAVTAAGR